MVSVTGPEETERVLHAALDAAWAADDLLQAFRLGFDLAGHLLRQGRSREAFGINHQLPSLGTQAHAGRWSMIAVDVQRLMILNALGDDVTDRVRNLRDRIAELRAADDTKGEDEPISPHAAREVLLILGVRAASDARRWSEALTFSDDLLAGMRERGATVYELAEAQHNRYVPLFNLGDLDAAEMIMLHCREVYEAHGHSGDLARTYGALGEIAWARGLAQQAAEFQKETLRHAYRHPELRTIAPAHKHFARYLGEDEPEDRLAHSLLSAIAYQLSGQEERYRNLVSEIANRRYDPGLLEAVTPEWLTAVVSRVDGVDLTALERETHLHRETPAAGLARILFILRQDSANDALFSDTLQRRWEPALATLVAAANGDRDAAAALSQHLDVRELAPEWTRLVSALRLVLSGERDPSVLLTDLDTTDAAIVTSTLDALAGRFQPSATPADLAAVTHDARQRHRAFLDMTVAAARGQLLARDDLREWVGHINRDPSQQKLTTAVLAAVGGAREPDRVFDELAPSQIRLIRAIVEAIDAGDTVTGQHDASADELYEALSDPIGPSNADIRAILSEGNNLEQAITTAGQGISRRLAAGDTRVPMRVLELVLPVLLSRRDFRNALPMAETLASMRSDDPTITIRPELINLVCLAAIQRAERIAPGGTQITAGLAAPRRTPAPLGTLPDSGTITQTMRWLAVARSLHPLAPESFEPMLTLAEAIASRAAGDNEQAIEKLRPVLETATHGETSDRGLAEMVSVLLVEAYTRHGDLYAALELCDHLVAARAADSPYDTAEALVQRGNVLMLLGRDRQALADLHQAEALLASDDDAEAGLILGPAYEKLGGLYERHGDLAAAANIFGRAFEIARRTGHHTGETAMLMALGSLFGKLSTGYLRSPAQAELNEAVAVLNRIDPEFTYRPTPEGTRSVAVTLLRRAADQFRAANNEAGWGQATNGLCNLMPDEQSEEAVVLLTEVLRAKGSDRLGQAITLANLASRLRILGRLDDAEDALRRSLDISRAAGYFESAVQSTVTLGSYTYQRGDRGAAEAAFRDAVALIESARPHQPPEDQARVTLARQYADAYAGLVACLLERGADAEAFDVVQQAKSRALLGLVATSDLWPSRLANGRFAEVLAAEAEQLPARFEALLIGAARSGDHETFDRGIDSIRGAIASLPGDDPSAASFHELLGRALRTRFQRTGDMDDLEDCISSLRAVLAAGPTDDPRRPEVQAGLAASLRDRYESTGVPRDLDEAIELTETVVRGLRPDDPRAAAIAADLGKALRERFEAAGATADIDASIGWLKGASDQVDRTGPVRPQLLADLAHSHQTRYRRLGDLGDLGVAIGLLREAVDSGHPRPASMLVIMLGMLRDRFKRVADPADLDAAIDAGLEALALPTSPEEGTRQWLRMQVSDSYLERFDLTGRASDLDAVVRLLQEDIDASPPDTPQRLVRLASARRHLWLRMDLDRVPDHLRAHTLFDRAAMQDPDQLAAEASVMLRWAEQADRVTAVEMAIWLLRDALPGFATTSDKWLDAMSDLATALDVRGERTGAVADLDEAISLQRQVLDVARSDHPRQPGFHSNLATSLRHRFLATGQMADLDTAVMMARVAAASNPHPRRAMYLTNLAALLGDRYDHVGSVSDLQEAIQVNREAVAATDPDDPNRARNLSNLASALLGSVKATDSEAHATEAIAVLTEALSLTPAQHPGRAMRLDNLGMAYRLRHQLTRDVADLGHAVRYSRQAVLARDTDDPDRAKSLAGLGITLVTQHRRTGDLDSLTEGIAVSAEAVASTPPEHPDRPAFLLFLGDALETRYETSDEPADKDSALAAYRDSALASTGPASSRLSAAQRWAELAMSRPGQHESALTGYTVAAELLHRVAWRGLTRADRERALTSWPNLAGDMAACALAGQLAGRAVELLENGRAVIWSQMLDLRTDLSGTRIRAPALGAILTRLEEIRVALDGPATSI
jgi:tetratricopeptide (TPR) repeat protein